jgi:SH3-like domain-containing protein
MNTKNRLSFISFLLFAAMMILLPSFSAATAAETAGYEVTPCEKPVGSGYRCTYALVYDTDPAGTNVRSGPGTDNPVVTRINSNKLVMITGSAGEWMRVETYQDESHITGWIHGTRLMVPVHSPGALYTEPDTKSSLIARIPEQTYVTVAGCRGNWMKVRYRDLEGWLALVSCGLLETEIGEGDWSDGAAETDNSPVTFCYCRAYVAEPDPKGLAVRSAPGDDSPVVTTLPRRTPVFITGSVGEWMRISTLTIVEQYGDWGPGDPIGWTYGHLLAVRARYSEFGAPSPFWDSSGNVLVFAEPITGSAVVTKIPRDTEVTLLGCWSGFLKVRYNGVEGWLPSYCGDPSYECR